MTLSGLILLAEKRAGVLLGAAVVVCLFLVSLMRERLGGPGPDGDDVMRLVQIRDLLAGQGWFDLSQPRLGPEGGTLMHWSRLADLPIVLMTFLLAPFVGQDAALMAAVTAWPILSSGIVVAGLVAGARGIGGRGAALVTAILTLVILCQHFRFLAGSIDHHNLQLGLLMLSAGLLVDTARSPMRSTGAGVAAALAVAVGAEVYVFVGVIAAFVALEWALTGERARPGAVTFGASFAAGLAAIFLLTVSPEQYSAVRCDALSIVSLVAGGIGGTGLALAAQLNSGRAVSVRLMSLGALGLVCGGVLLAFGPQCMSNPLDSLPPEVQALWLSRVDEARPTLAYLGTQPGEVTFRLGTLVAGIAAALYLAILRPEVRRMAILLGLLTAVSLLCALYQTRFYVFGQLFAILPLATLVAMVHSGRAAHIPKIAYLAVLALSLPPVWGAAGNMLRPAGAAAAVEAAELTSEACDIGEIVKELNTLPAGRVLAPASYTPHILLYTDHSVLYGHYHRNGPGMAMAINIFLVPPEEARPALAGAKAGYILVCPGEGDALFFSHHAPDGLLAQLADENVPGWMSPVLTAGGAVVYEVAMP